MLLIIDKLLFFKCKGELLLLCAQKHPKLPTDCPDSLAMLSYLVLAGVDFALIHDSHALQGYSSFRFSFWTCFS